MYLTFYLENQRMPDVSEMNDICKRLSATVQALAPKTGYEDFYKIVEKRALGYESRILKDIQGVITIETLNTKNKGEFLKKKQMLRNKRSSRGGRKRK